MLTELVPLPPVSSCYLQSSCAQYALPETTQQLPGTGVQHTHSTRVQDAIGRKWQCSTIQLDFNLPERFEMQFVASDNTKQRPIMIHRAILGSVERFFGILTENYAGAFPAWLAPVQCQLLPVSESCEDFCEALMKQMRQSGLRAEMVPLPLELLSQTPLDCVLFYLSPACDRAIVHCAPIVPHSSTPPIVLGCARSLGLAFHASNAQILFGARAVAHPSWRACWFVSCWKIPWLPKPSSLTLHWLVPSLTLAYLAVLLVWCCIHKHFEHGWPLCDAFVRCVCWQTKIPQEEHSALQRESL
jgi:hypothetical protein